MRFRAQRDRHGWTDIQTNFMHKHFSTLLESVKKLKANKMYKIQIEKQILQINCTLCNNEIFLKIKIPKLEQIRKEKTMNYKPKNHLWPLSRGYK